MKKTSLIIGVLLMILAVISGIICLLLPSLSSNRVSAGEAKFGLIPAGIAFLIGLLITYGSLLFILKARKAAMMNDFQNRLQPEGIVLFENVNGAITYRNFHCPGSSSLYRKVGLSGLLALTQKRLLALNGTQPVIDVSLTDERLKQMKFSLEGEDKLCATFDANLFQPEWTGEVEYRFKTAKAAEFLQKINGL